MYLQSQTHSRLAQPWNKFSKEKQISLTASMTGGPCPTPFFHLRTLRCACAKYHETSAVLSSQQTWLPGYGVGRSVCMLYQRWSCRRQQNLSEDHCIRWLENLQWWLWVLFVALLARLPAWAWCELLELARGHSTILVFRSCTRRTRRVPWTWRSSMTCPTDPWWQFWMSTGTSSLLRSRLK